MKTFKTTLHFTLIVITLLACGCSRKTKEQSAIEIQESINEQVTIAKEYLTNGKNNQAIILLEGLLKQHPHMITIIEALAFAHMDCGDPGLAAFYFEQIVRKEPSLHEYKIFAAQAYSEARNYSQACRSYKHYLDFFSNDRATWKALAKVYELDKMDSHALEAYLEAIHLTSSPVSEHDALKIARLYLKTNNDQEAKTWYHKVLTRNPESVEAHTRLLKLELQCANWSEAQKHLAKLETMPANKVDPALIKLAKDLCLRKPSIEAQKQSVVAESKSAPADIDTYLKEAKKLRSNGDFSNSIANCKKALALNPKAADAWYQLSLACLGNNDVNAAESNAKEAMNIEPKNLNYTFNYLKIIKANGSNELLFGELKKAKKRFPNNPEITLTLAQAYHKTGNDKQNAKIFYEEFLQQAPNHDKSNQVKQLLSSF